MNWAAGAIASKILALGQNVVVKGAGGDVASVAIVDPVERTSEKSGSASGLPDGYYPPGSYQYFGLPETDLTEATAVKTQTDFYIIRRKELYQVGGTNLYWWALLIRGGEKDE